jgi:hypothetical protein
LVDEQLDSLLGSLPCSPPCTVEGLEQHTLMRQLSLDGDAERTRK